MQPVQKLAAALVLGAFGAGVSAQTATWTATVTTANGDSIIDSGLGESSATVTLWVNLDPDVDAKRVLGFAYAIFDTIGGLNAATGQVVDWSILNDLSILIGDLTTTDGVNLYNTNVSQLYSFGPFTTADPIDVFQFTWTTANFTPRKVVYDVQTFDIGAWVDPLMNGNVVVQPWAVAGGKINFSVK